MDVQKASLKGIVEFSNRLTNVSVVDCTAIANVTALVHNLVVKSQNLLVDMSTNMPRMLHISACCSKRGVDLEFACSFGMTDLLISFFACGGVLVLRTVDLFIFDSMVVFFYGYAPVFCCLELFLEPSPHMCAMHGWREKRLHKHLQQQKVSDLTQAQAPGTKV